ncbi:hypothetical protein PLICRDRAFT_701478 [Plicaturopsis crispa FD-325 SS-3]|uniref:Unplaced genomic scaffold PLICRscaffold_16, whole genome shotgun sequence n=1 Tax=Plicaturopsis crispa FD-325 SS-3 TaxID=944288 RepID=A0A0C9SY18_PLICR|nr:hypothetical protein PLICRDRAFT_701478 [Plicaturopsis crispa FD-325 SS-3]
MIPHVSKRFAGALNAPAWTRQGQRSLSSRAGDFTDGQVRVRRVRKLEREVPSNLPVKTYVDHLRALQNGRACGFHTSARALGADSYNDEHVVPHFYVKRKKERSESASDQQRDAVKSRKGEEASLMDHLSDSILSDEIAASTRRLKTKIPAEYYNAEGILVHPSGFEVPAAGTAKEPMSERRDRDNARQTAAVAERVLEEDFTDVSADTRARNSKVPWEIRREDGRVEHPSGFVPPTPMHGFKVSMSADPPSLVSRRDTHWDDSYEGTPSVGDVPKDTNFIHEEDPRVSKPSTSSTPIHGTDKRGVHSSAVMSAETMHRSLSMAPKPVV